MDFTALQIVVGVLCTLYLPLKSQTSDDKYFITTGRSPKAIYVYKGELTDLSWYNAFRIEWESWYTNIDIDVANSTIFVLDSVWPCVSNLSSIVSSKSTIHVLYCGTSKGSAIAYDWVTSNMYWSDERFQWIALRPMYTTDTQLYRVIIQEVTDIPALAVDPINRYIFWFDKAPSGGRIERASLGGQQRKAILTTGLLFVKDIVVDVTSKKVFWVDILSYSIESANYEGFQRQLLHRSLQTIYSLAVDKEHVCATLPDNKAWICVNKTSRDYKIVHEQRKPYGIAIFDKAIQPQDKSNFCASAFCQDLCVNGDDRGICMCKEGYTLNQDEKNCSATHGLFGKGILVSYKNQICILDYHSLIHGIAIDFNCTHTGLQGVEYLEVNAAEHVVFYYDAINKHIKSYNLRSRTSKTIHGSTGIVSGLSFDWNQMKLYWCESNTGIIGRVSLRNDITEIFLDSDKDVNDISVDPHNRHYAGPDGGAISKQNMAMTFLTVFWIEGRTTILSSKIEDGKNRIVLDEGGTKSGLFFESKSSRLYWIHNSVIASMIGDGSDIKIHTSASSSTQLIMFKSYLVWISDNQTLESSLTTSADNIKITLPENGTITGIAVFDESSQPMEKGACDVHNGGCDHICIVVIDGRVCRCQFGFTLNSDGKSCGTLPLNLDFVLATDFTHSRIYQVALQSGSIQTLDIPFVSSPVAVRYDSTNKYLYWAELNNPGRIMRASKDGKNVSIIYYSVFGTYPERIELDQSSGYLYFLASDRNSSDKGYIGVINTHNMYHKILLKGLQYTHGFAIYPLKGICFFTNRKGSTNHIYRSTMDGLYRYRIYTTTSIINDLIIDYNADHLYWSEANVIWFGDMSGLSRKKLETAKFVIYSIVLVHPYIYFYSVEHRKIMKFDITKKQPVTWMSDVPEIGFLFSLDIFPKAAMPGNLLCDKRNGMCSTFCLPREKSTTCGCRENVLLLSDGKTCDDVTQCSKQVQFGTLEATCQRYAGETCSFVCESDYIPNVQPQAVTCQENGTWNHNPLELCSETATNTAVIAGGVVAGVVAIGIGVIGLIKLVRRKKSGSAQLNALQTRVYYSSQSVKLPQIRQQIPPSYAELE